MPVSSSFISRAINSSIASP